MMVTSQFYCRLAMIFKAITCQSVIELSTIYPKMVSLARWLSFNLQTDGLWVQILIQSFQIQLSRLFQATNLLRFKLLKIHSRQVCKQTVAIAAAFSLSFSATSGVKHLRN